MDKILNINLEFEIEILSTSKEIPIKEENNFTKWIKYKSAEVGLGRQFEYYSYNENYKDDIGVSFMVSLKKIKDI